MGEYLLIRLEGPLQSWGEVSLDAQRPTSAFPTKSALTGLLASAMGWTYEDGARINQLQDCLDFAVREDRRPVPLREFQSVDLGRESGGWTRWGYEGRGGSQKSGTHLMEKGYLADGSFLVALATREGPVGLDQLEQALRAPARPVFLGRKSCPPSRALFDGRAEGLSARDVLSTVSVRPEYDVPPLRCWGRLAEGESSATSREVWHRRNFESDLFAGSETLVETTVEPPVESPS